MAKKQKKQYGMGPAQSMAMAGNTGLASFTQKDIEKVQQAKRDYNEFSGRDRNQNASFTDIGQEIGELGSKYRRPVKIADGLGAYSDESNRAYTPNDFNSDGSFRSFTASRPTFRQMMGDVGRAFTGYNTLKYDNPGRGYSPVSMQRTPGMIELGILSPLTTMAKAALGATNDLAGQTKNLYSGTVDLFKEGLGKLNDIQQQIFMNPEKYKYARQQEDIINAEEKEDEVKRLETLNEKIEADRKQFEELLNISALQDNLNTINPESFRKGRELFQQDNSYSKIPPVVSNRPTYAASGDTRPPLNTINPESFREGRELFQQDNSYSKIPPVSNLIDQTFPDNVLNTEEIDQSAPGITSLVNNFDASNIVTEDDRTSSLEDFINNSPKITPYNNAFNLEFRNQPGAEPGYGGEDGKRFASFSDVNTGLREGFGRVSEIVGDGRSTKSFLDVYAPRSDNEETYDEYLKELVKKVGYTIEPDEVDDLGKAIIKQENKREISDQYLDYLQKNANKIYDGIISSKNNTMLAGLTDEQKTLLDDRRGKYDMGIFGIQEMLDQLPDGDPNNPATYEDVQTYLS